MASRTQAQITKMLADLGERRWQALTEVTREGEPDGIGVTLVAAIGVRETNIQNIVGDGGHGRGWLQIDDRFHAPWLASHPGVVSGTWDRYDGKSALVPGHCPSFTRSAMKAIELLRANKAYAIKHGIPSGIAVQFAVASYNCGAGNTIAAYRRYGARGLDRYTTGRDYSADVYDIKDIVADVARKRHWPIG